MKKIKYLILLLVMSLTTIFLIKPVYAVTINDTFFGSILLEPGILGDEQLYAIYFEVEDYNPNDDDDIFIRNNKAYYNGNYYDMFAQFDMYYPSGIAILNFKQIYELTDQIYYEYMGLINEIDVNSFYVFNSEGISILTGDIVNHSLIAINIGSFETWYKRNTNTNHDYYQGYNDGKSIGYNDGYNIGYKQGNDAGYGSGYNVGYNNGNDAGYDIGYDAGYNKGNSDGYNEGYELGLTNKIDWFNWAFTFITMPVRILNVEVLPGIKIGYFALFTLMTGIVSWFFFIVGKGGRRK